MNTVAQIVLLLLLLVVLIQLAKGTLGTWFRTKFLGLAPSPAPAVADSSKAPQTGAAGGGGPNNVKKKP